MIEIKQILDPEIKSKICEKVLRDLPKWFGIESATLNYIRSVKDLDTWAAFENHEAIGFISVNKHNKYTAEIHVIGVLQKYHRLGIGRKLLVEAERSLEKQKFLYLQVKTISESSTNPEYARTRKFYSAEDFKPVEEFKNLWGESNPCLLLIKNIQKA